MMDLSFEKDASIYIPEDTTASSSESSDDQQSKGDQLSVQRAKMNEFLKSCCVGAIGSCKKRWEESSIRTKNSHVSKAKDLVVAALNVTAPGDAGLLWEALKASNCVEKVLKTSEEESSADRRYLEALAETYRNASCWELGDRFYQ